MEKERLYEVTISEKCNAAYCGSCHIATVSIKSKSANEAIEKALEKANNKIKSELLFASYVKCIGQLQL